MKAIKFLPLLLLFLVASCSSIKVSADYDTKTDFSKYKTFAFYKKGIDKVEIIIIMAGILGITDQILELRFLNIQKALCLST